MQHNLINSQVDQHEVHSQWYLYTCTDVKLATAGQYVHIVRLYAVVTQYSQHALADHGSACTSLTRPHNDRCYRE